MRIIAFILGFLAAPAAAHEFWIEPLEYQLPVDRNLQAHIVNGEGFSGTKLPFIPQRYVQFVNAVGSDQISVEGRIGNLPALDMSPLADGLNIIAYQAQYATVDYSDWSKFQKFVDHKDLGDVLARHQARGLPMENFVEIYARFSKSLIAVGDGNGDDRRIGLETEIVALSNPYRDNLDEGMRIQLFYDQAPRADAQIEVFEKATDGSVAIETYRTDEDGVAMFPVRSGMQYMVDAVVLREPTAKVAENSEAVWETLWANLTFATP